MAVRDISFATFNLYNLQRPGERLYNRSTPWTEEQYADKLAFTADMLRRFSADVVGFQELWAAEALTEAVAQAGIAADHVTLVPPGHADDRIVCAATVRSAILEGEPRWITEFPPEMVLESGGDDPQAERISVTLSTFSRPVLHLRVKPYRDTPVIEVFVCHFKSRRPTDVWREGWYEKEVHSDHRTAIGYAISTIRRTAEAAALRVLITKLTKNADTPVVVLGDLNDGKMSNTLNLLTEQPRYLAGLSLGGGDNALYTAQTLQEYRSTRDVYYTHVYQKERESLDHILFSQEFYDNSRRRLWVFDEMIVQNDHLDFDDHKETGSTDHGVVRASFKWRPAEGAAIG